MSIQTQEFHRHYCHHYHYQMELQKYLPLPETIDMDGETTPYEGNYIDVEDSEETSNTIYLPGYGKEGATRDDECTVDLDGNVEALIA